MNEVKKDKNTWVINVDGDEVIVKNETSTLGLYVNNKLQDVCLGMVSFDNIRLEGTTSNDKKIKVVVGGNLKLRCYIFVDDECVFEDK